MAKRRVFRQLVGEELEARVLLDAVSIGPYGVNARNLLAADAQATVLDGTGIKIGQVEQQRPGKPGFDNPPYVSTSVNPTGVYYGTEAAFWSSEIGDHAISVAGTMISTVFPTDGIAPAASLYAAGYPEPNNPFAHQTRLVRAAQHVAINMGTTHSPMNVSLGSTGTADYTSPASLGLDWLAMDSLWRILPVIAVGNSPTSLTPPDDSHNAIHVAATTKAADGQFRIARGNNSVVSVFGHALTDILAPGDLLVIDQMGTTTTVASGTSLAAPHVTGAIALLQQYGTEMGWANTALRNVVMRAVLLNSADKIKDDGTFVFNGAVVPQGHLLGMDKTILDQNGNHWLATQAYASNEISLDTRLGAGQLNVDRALKQYNAGRQQFNAAGGVTARGWDYQVPTPPHSIIKYPIAGTLKSP